MKNKRLKYIAKIFSGVKVRCLKHHAKPSLRLNLDHFALHVGTSNRLPNMQNQSYLDTVMIRRKEKHDYKWNTLNELAGRVLQLNEVCYFIMGFVGLVCYH